jgi:fluoride exporter
VQAEQRFLIVFFGAGLGGISRHAVNLVVLRVLGPGLPIATLTVNVLGSLALGAIAGYVSVRSHASPVVQLFLITGILGGFTTFSTFALEAALLWQRGQVLGFALYVLGSVSLSIAAVFVGLALARY